MEESLLLYSSLFIVFLLIFKLFLTKSKKLPPSPFALPILGHLHLLKQPLHRTLQNLSQKYGPILSLKFGSKLVVVVSSSSAAEECLSKNDLVLANRPHFTMNKYLGYNSTTLVSSSYGEHWRNLRHITMVEVFSPKRLNMLTGVVRDEVKILLGKLQRVSAVDKFTKVELRPLISALTFNIITRMIAGKRFFGEEVDGNEEAKQFRQLVKEMFADGGGAYPGDFLPLIKYFDLTGYIKKVTNLGTRVDMFFQGLVDEFKMKKGSLESGNTMIGHLLSLQESQPEQYTDEIIKGLALNMVAGGTHIVAATLEWAMSNLLNNPRVLKKARADLDASLGSKQLVLDELDVSKLHYLQNIISESYRLNPVVPLLVPHMSSDYCTIGGYNVPPNTILLVNMWAIHRDEKNWDDPTCFNPERFDTSEVDAYKLFPFGVGRRICPGIGLANRTVGLTLGSLIQCFEWERVDGKEIDMVEGSAGIAVPKLEPLDALCKTRSFMKDALIQAVN
ncbi:Cytochrome P450 [Corchorus olitorius]|uniref:Cytochrome P450 n=1 Tax=Corchorus olitorius TaxID=93759 RepID=A0A1R3K4A5_9ROSI|nr:Cytochrome P450 [Corchorus olitorius]